MSSLPDSEPAPASPAPAPAAATGLFCEHRNIRRTCAVCTPRPVVQEEHDGLTTATRKTRKPAAKGRKTTEKKAKPQPQGTADQPIAWWVKRE